jgi:membrane protein implicated in regulation of membrane protease activity
MAWWVWCIGGVLLFGVELGAVDAQFYLVFAGAAAIVVGLVGLVGIDLPPWGQWLLFAALSLIAMFTIRKQIYDMLSRAPGKVSGDVDQRVVLSEDLSPGATCRVEYRGSGWTALNIGEQVIPAGAHARIAAVEGLTLHVRAF